jgi:thioredoxin 1
LEIQGEQMGITKTIASENFESDVLKADKPVLVDFWAEWCLPCKAISPMMDQLALEFNGKMEFAKVDVDRNPEMAAQLGIRSIPTMIVFSGGEEKERLVGSFPKSHVKKRIEQYTGK